MQSSADFITITFGFRFSVHTGATREQAMADFKAALERKP
jgi:hypothetical protein